MTTSCPALPTAACTRYAVRCAARRAPALALLQRKPPPRGGHPRAPPTPKSTWNYARELTRRSSGDQIRYGTRIEPWGGRRIRCSGSLASRPTAARGYRDVTIISDATMEALQHMYDLEHTYGVSGPSWIVDGNVSMQVSGIGGLSEIQRLRSQGVMNIQVARVTGSFGSAQLGDLRGLPHVCVPVPSQSGILKTHMAAMEFIKWTASTPAGAGQVRPAACLEGGGQSREFQSSWRTT